MDDVAIKLRGIGKLICREKISAVIFGGDLWDSPHQPYATIDLVLDEIEKWDVPIYSILGSHDMSGYNIESSKFLAIGHSANRSSSFSVLYSETNIGAPIVPIHHTEDVEKMLKSPMKHRPPAICPCHAMLTKNAFFVGGDRLGVSYEETQCFSKGDVVLIGHNHARQGVFISSDGVTFIAPGSAGRTKKDETHVPCVAIFKWNGIGLSGSAKLIDIPRAREWPFMNSDEEATDIEAVDEFIESADGLNFRGCDPVDVVQRAGAAMKTGNKVIGRAIAAVQKAMKGGSNFL